LNIIRGHVRQFRQEYGEVVLCCDNKNYWRKEFFPFYKAGRKKAREKSDLDWHLIFDILGKLKLELKEKKLPYILKRPLPNGTYEYWRLSDLLILE
jgi:hypothetical protein